MRVIDPHHIDPAHDLVELEVTGVAAKVKAQEEFRNYNDSERQALVERTYLQMHIGQTVDFVKGRHARWLKFDKTEMTIWEAIELLDTLVDDSDPDTALPNSLHDFQTAERIRQAHPDKDWMHLVGLLHDIGKVLALWGEPQWAVVGDTFPVGCQHSDQIVFAHQMKENGDANDPRYNTTNGIYEPGCGIANLTMSWGHDEYMYQLLKHNGCTIPQEGLDMVRFHSFYPWHDKGAYTHLMAPGDEKTLEWVKEFNKFDLYSKSDALPDKEALKPYYHTLLEKYNISGKLKF
mmetsp:Transcript_2776/g.7266  ORF Transcript_2776/g.7266 Transcript_2776/m.7266 type:complete len:291 (+) Transcript_2776:64-936(+)